MQGEVVMLVMKVQRDDMVIIGDDIRIYVRQVSGGGVKLCIDAPRDVEVTRLAAPSRDSRPSAPQVVPGALDETPDGDEREARGSEAAGPR